MQRCIVLIKTTNTVYIYVLYAGKCENVKEIKVKLYLLCNDAKLLYIFKILKFKNSEIIKNNYL